MTCPVVLAGVWLCGVVVVLGVWGGGWRKVMRTLRRAVRAEDDDGREVRILRRVEAAMGARRPVRLMLSREWMEPGIFGILRPVLIWPEGLSARLDDEHIEAIVAHELMHARRRDNLTAALHMLVEAAFWFHPLVWWMERRMVEERERACDEAVVEMGSRPGVYAESLLKAVRFCVESPLVCVAGVTGADLNRRVRSIMTLRLRKLGVAGKVGLTALGLAAIAVPLAFGVVRMIPVYGQVLKATGPLPSYEVVVIKPSQEGARGASTEGEETHYLMTAKMLIQFAYGIFNPPKVMDLNVVGGPDWINTDVFSIVGKMDSAEFEQEQKLGRAQKHERRQLMEQSLLADRFKLKMHTETRDVPVYALTVIKGGPKMTPAKDVTGGAHVNPNPGSTTPEQLTRGLIVQAKGRNFVMTVKGMTLDFFVDALGAQKETAGKQVVNQTGLTGAYDFTLTWGPEDSASVDNGNSNEVIEPPLFTAIQQQLGLKLADGKGPAEVVVIDHIEKPVFDEADGTAKASVVAAAVATGERLLGNLVPAALVQEKAAPVSDSTPTMHGGYRMWLDQDARWLITPAERAAFLELTNDQQREEFIEHFWEQKGSAAGMSGSVYKAEIYGRFAYANEHFAADSPGWSTDRGRIYVVFGKPDEVKAQPADGIQTWVYHRIAGVGENVTLNFVRLSGTADYQLVTPYPTGLPGNRYRGINWTALPQGDAPADFCCGGGNPGDSATGRVNSKTDKTIYFFRLGWAYVLPTGLEFHASEPIVPYNGLPPHGTYGLEQRVPERMDATGVMMFMEEVVMLDDGSRYEADHQKIEAEYEQRVAARLYGPAVR